MKMPYFDTVHVDFPLFEQKSTARNRKIQKHAVSSDDDEESEEESEESSEKESSSEDSDREIKRVDIKKRKNEITRKQTKEAKKPSNIDLLLELDNCKNECFFYRG